MIIEKNIKFTHLISTKLVILFHTTKIIYFQWCRMELAFSHELG